MRCWLIGVMTGIAMVGRRVARGRDKVFVKVKVGLGKHVVEAILLLSIPTLVSTRVGADTIVG